MDGSQKMTARRPSRMWQVFCGPEALEILPDDGYVSPWSFPSQVRIPMEHWDAIVAFAQGLDGEQAALLEYASNLDGKVLDPVTETRFVSLLERLADAVVSADPLTPDGSDPALIPEPMPNTSHAIMLRDIARHVRRTRSLGMVFDSWVD